VATRVTLPTVQLGGRLERSMQGAQNPLLSWFTCPECLCATA